MEVEGKTWGNRPKPFYGRRRARSHGEHSLLPQAICLPGRSGRVNEAARVISTITGSGAMAPGLPFPPLPSKNVSPGKQAAGEFAEGKHAR